MNTPFTGFILALTAMFATSNLHAQCNEGAFGECDEEHPSGGCRVTECCDVVCEVDPLCCEIVWDSPCVTLSEDLCDGYACPGLQPCDSTSVEPGCSDADCCRLTCNHDYFCCWVEWDAHCIALAGTICEVTPCEIAIPDGTPDEGEFCYERINDGCNISGSTFGLLPCGSSVSGTCTTDSPRDTDWYSFEVDARLTMSIMLHSEFPAQVVLVSGECTGPLEAVLVADCDPCSELQFDIDLEPGTWGLVISPGSMEGALREAMTCDLEDPKDPPDKGDPPIEPSYFGLRYLLSLECTHEQSPGDLNGDGVVDGEDILLVLAWWGSSESSADADGNGIVDGGDLLIVLAYWTH